MMMLGGSGTLFGPTLGAILITIIMELLRGVNGAGMYLQISYGILLLVVMMFMPHGVNGKIAEIKQKKMLKEKKRK